MMPQTQVPGTQDKGHQNTPRSFELKKYWIPIFIVFFGIFIVLPFFAPVAMHLGLNPVANVIYTGYSALCHQMAQRSFFFFGADTMYNIDQLPIDLAGDAGDMWLLRQFRGNLEYGWKVAWSDRMVYMYGSMWVTAFVYYLVSRQRARRPIPLWLFAVLMLPMIFDGVTHMVSDVFGLVEGFRYHNSWLATLTNSAFPEHFYVGDGLGSFNSWMRLFSGITFGIAVVGFLFPIIDREIRLYKRQLADKQAHLERLYEQTMEEIENPVES